MSIVTVHGPSWDSKKNSFMHLAGPDEIMSGQTTEVASLDEPYVSVSPSAPVSAPAAKPTGPSAVTTDYDPSEHTIPQVQLYVQEHPMDAQVILEKERNGRNRPTLINFLRAR